MHIVSLSLTETSKMALVSEFLGQLTLNFGVGFSVIKKRIRIRISVPRQGESQTVTLHFLKLHVSVERAHVSYSGSCR